MAKLNGQEIRFKGLSFTEIGEKLVEASPNKDGKGLQLELNEIEEEAFANWGGLKVGLNLATLIGDALQKEGKTPDSIAYNYDWHTRTFTT